MSQIKEIKKGLIMSTNIRHLFKGRIEHYERSFKSLEAQNKEDYNRSYAMINHPVIRITDQEIKELTIEFKKSLNNNIELLLSDNKYVKDKCIETNFTTCKYEYITDNNGNNVSVEESKGLTNNLGYTLNSGQYVVINGQQVFIIAIYFNVDIKAFIYETDYLIEKIYDEESKKKAEEELEKYIELKRKEKDFIKSVDEEAKKIEQETIWQKLGHILRGEF